MKMTRTFPGQTICRDFVKACEGCIQMTYMAAYGRSRKKSQLQLLSRTAALRRSLTSTARCWLPTPNTILTVIKSCRVPSKCVVPVNLVLTAKAVRRCQTLPFEISCWEKNNQTIWVTIFNIGPICQLQLRRILQHSKRLVLARRVSRPGTTSAQTKKHQLTRCRNYKFSNFLF